MTSKSDLVEALERLNEVFIATDQSSVIAGLEGQLDAPNMHPVVHSMILNGLSRYINNDLLHKSATSAGQAEYSEVRLPVGFLSYEKSAILGKKGHAYLIGGSNDVIGQYHHRQENEGRVDAWNALLADRKANAEQRDVRLFHVIFPEKITLLPEYFPDPISVPTRLYEQLESEVFRKEDETYISGRKVFWKDDRRDSCCRQLDSHLTPRGSFVVFKEILRISCNIILTEPSFDLRQASIGDLCFRILGIFVEEEFYATEIAAPAPIKTGETSAAPGSHMGFSQSWVNAEAKIDKKVVVFGNSFFSRFENGQSTLSWWFAHYFSEFHFFWTNEILWEKVDEIKPDVVFWQGIERFLPIVPGR